VLTASGLDVRPITDVAALEALHGEWSELFERAASASPFQSPAWLLPWTRTFLHEGLWTLTVREAGRLVGLLPLFIHRWPDGMRQLTLIGNGVTDHLDLLAEPGRAGDIAAAVLAFIQSRADAWDAVDWRDLPAGSPLIAASEAFGADLRIEAEEPCPARPLAARAEAVLGALPRKRRENVSRRRRRLAEQGEVSVVLADASNRIDLLSALLELHARRWESRGEAGVLADAAVQAFHEQATAALLQAGMLQLQALRLDGEIIAAHYGLRWGRTAYSYIHGFAPDHAAFAPSTLLIVEAMEEAVRAGCTTFDFLRGREPYKYDLGGADQPKVRVRFTRRDASA
jgi:CelD/BcsL family acetyltransferase involved in cellulose biosynthesis